MKITTLSVMKKYRFILSAIFLSLIFASFNEINGQEKSREEKLREQEDKSKIQEEINQQKREMIENRKHEDIRQALDESREQIDQAMQDVRESIHEYNDEKGQQRGAGHRPDAPFSFAMPGFSFDGIFMGDDTERSSLSLSRSLKETSFKRDYVFDVAQSAKTVSMSINGYSKAGEIRIKIKMPDGKTYSDVIIDESGNLNWRKSFNISGDENRDKTGDWKFEIDASKATGYFRISLQTY